MFKKDPTQLTPAAIQSAREAFIRSHQAVFDRWFEQLEQQQLKRFSVEHLEDDAPLSGHEAVST